MMRHSPGSRYLAVLSVIALVFGITPTAGFAVDEDPPTEAVAAQETGTLTVTLTDAVTGEPLEGREVSLVDPETGETVAQAVTNADGEVEFADLGFGEYQLSALDQAGPMATVNAENLAPSIVFPLELEDDDRAAGGVLGSALLALAVSAAGVGVAVNEVTEDESP